MICSPATGFGSKAPNWVTTTPGLLKSAAKAGRSVNRVSPFRSRPIVMLKGLPDEKISIGLRLIFHGPRNRWIESPWQGRVNRARAQLVQRTRVAERNAGGKAVRQ